MQIKSNNHLNIPNLCFAKQDILSGNAVKTYFTAAQQKFIYKQLEGNCNCALVVTHSKQLGVIGNCI